MDSFCACVTCNRRKIFVGLVLVGIVCTTIIYKQASVIRNTVRDKKSLKAIFLENQKSLPYPTKKLPMAEPFKNEIPKIPYNLTRSTSLSSHAHRIDGSFVLNKRDKNNSLPLYGHRDNGITKIPYNKTNIPRSTSSHTHRSNGNFGLNKMDRNNSLPLLAHTSNSIADLNEVNRNNSYFANKNFSEYIHSHFTGYAVISVATSRLNTLERYHYVFSVPLAILAWKRIGYESIVLISGSQNEWIEDSCLKVILDYLKELHTLYLFIETEEHQRVMMSQVSRIFASSLLSQYLKDTDYLIISDVDLWPLETSYYTLKQNKQILVLNSECCGSFTYHGEFFRMVPMANIGASVKTWKQLIIGRNQSLPKTGDEIISYLQNEFGDIVNRRVTKGENEGWYMDQRLISMLLYAWIHKYSITLIDFVPRNVGMDRIDRSWWSTKTFEGKIDIHILDNIFMTGRWLKTLPVLRNMYGGNEHSALYTMCLLYFNDFETALRKRNNK